MSKLSYDDVLAGLSHEDIFVRSGALIFLVESGLECRVDASHVVFDVLEDKGWEGSFTHHGYISDLPIDREIGARLISYLAKEGEESQLQIFYEWFSKASPEVCLTMVDKMEAHPAISTKERNLLDHVRYRISLLDLDAETCRSMLETLIVECIEGDDTLDEEIYRIKAVVERIAQFNDAHDAELVKIWIQDDAKFEDEYDLTVEEMRVCVGFTMAKELGISVSLERCLECLAPQFEWLSDSVIDTMIAAGDDALLNELMRRYPKSSHTEKDDFLVVFEKIHFSGAEAKLRDLAILEKDIGLRSHLGVVLTLYGTDQGVKYANDIVEEIGEEIEASDIIDVLYAVRVMRGESSPELKEWRHILEEIHEVTLKVLSGEISISEL